MSRTRWPISSSPKCCFSNPKTPTRTSTCTSTRPAVGLRRGWRSTTRCSSSSRDVCTICVGQAASDGRDAAGGRRQGQALLPAQLADHDSPAVGGLPKGDGYRDPYPRVEELSTKYSFLFCGRFLCQLLSQKGNLGFDIFLFVQEVSGYPGK